MWFATQIQTITTMFATNRARKTSPIAVRTYRSREYDAGRVGAGRATAASLTGVSIAAFYERRSAWRRSRARATKRLDRERGAAGGDEWACLLPRHRELEQRGGMCEAAAGGDDQPNHGLGALARDAGVRELV